VNNCLQAQTPVTVQPLDLPMTLQTVMMQSCSGFSTPAQLQQEMAAAAATQILTGETDV